MTLITHFGVVCSIVTSRAGCLIGRRAKQNGVGDAEDCGIRPDSERENGDDSHQEPWIFRKPPQRVDEIYRHSSIRHLAALHLFRPVSQLASSPKASAPWPSFSRCMMVESFESKYALVNLLRPIPLGRCR